MVRKVNGKTNRYYENRANSNFKFIEKDEEGSEIYKYGNFTVIYDDWDNGYDGRRRQATASSKDGSPYIFMNDKGTFTISYGYTARSIEDAKKKVADIQEAIKVAEAVKNQFGF